MAMIKVGNVNLPEPSSYKVTAQDIDSENTGRNENGIMFRERIRQDVYKIQVAWQNISESDKNTIINAIGNATFSVTFFYGSQTLTKTMYVGDRSCDLVWKPQTGSIWNVSVNFIEV